MSNHHENTSGFYVSSFIIGQRRTQSRTGETLQKVDRDFRNKCGPEIAIGMSVNGRDVTKRVKIDVNFIVNLDYRSIADVTAIP